jgi:hypothetical protein
VDVFVNDTGKIRVAIYEKVAGDLCFPDGSSLPDLQNPTIDLAASEIAASECAASIL